MLGVMGRRGLLAAGLLGLCSCGEQPPAFVDDDDSGSPAPPAVDERPVVRTATPPPPIFGGTLHVLANETAAMMAEPARDRVRIVGLDPRELLGEVVFEDGDLPWRMTETDDGVVWISLRGAGSIAAIDPSAYEIVNRVEVCPNVRGLAYDAQEHAIVTACAGGDVVFVDAENGDELQRSHHASDLRDVLVSEDSIQVTRFRTAELISVRGDDPELRLPSPTRYNSLVGEDETLAPRVAWRTVRRPGGGVVMLHQLATTRRLEFFEDGTPPRYYENAGCNGVANVAVGWTRNDAIVGTGPLAARPLSVDIAISPYGNRYALASPSVEADFGVVVGQLIERPEGEDGGGCDGTTPVPVEGTATSVAFHGHQLLVQTREPAALTFVTGAGEVYDQVELPGAPVSDTGHDLFHIDPGTGVTCASCHPEGGTDGHVWNFEFGPRATQPLDTDLANTAPYHWAGEHDDLAALIDDTHNLRMRAPRLSGERKQVFEEWLMSIPAPPPLRAAADDAAARGQEVFVTVGCDRCHDGPTPQTFGNIDFAGKYLQIPYFAGLATRPSFMHDGRAPTLRAAIVDMALRTAPDAALTDDDLDDLAAYLETF